ncbi:hypothetical protein JTB14_037167 [Gonioctena quinquepunctata]|nr:hypothetical protein JTB14_037167 [Gonioctena quinquepunctata]
MSSDTEAACIAIVITECLKRKQKRNRRRRRVWTKDWLKKRHQYTHESLLSDLRFGEPDDFRNFLRLDGTSYDELLEMVTPIIQKTNTNMRDAISPSQRLSITLRYLATGNTFEDLKFTSAISPQSISMIVMETCTALTHCLKEYIQIPKTEDEWKSVANDFYNTLNFPNCRGAVVGKYVAIKKPSHTGSYYYNYKKKALYYSQL